jgi:hypothetical protein
VIDLKGIAFNIMIFVIIALVSVVIFLLILNSIIPNFLGRGLCKLYQIVLSLPLPKQLKAPIPGCSIFPKMERIRIPEGMATPTTLTNYITKCWEKSEEGKIGQTFICYELFLEKVPNPIIPSSVAIPTTSINWRVGTIEGEHVTVIVKYNAELAEIEVI